MKEYTFGVFFGTLCNKQGLDPRAKKGTCQSWMNSSLRKLSPSSLQRLAQKAPEVLDLEMYKLPSIKQLIDLHNSLELEEPIEDQFKCNICNKSRWLILVNIETGEETVARCNCMRIHVKDGIFAQDLLDSGKYVTYNDYSKRESLLPENKARAEKFLKQVLNIKSTNEIKKEG